MSKKIVWNETGKRYYEAGVKNGVLYVQNTDGSYPKGVAWNGLINVNESPSGAETTPLYADDTKYVELQSNEDFGATIEAYTYPDEFEACDGSAEIAEGIKIGQQSRSTFGMCYRTVIGNDIEGNDHGYKIHIIYGCKAAPSEKSYQTINDSPEAITFSWEVTSTPVAVTGYKPTSSLVIDSRTVSPENLAKIEEALYGSESKDAYLPLPDAIVALMN